MERGETRQGERERFVDRNAPFGGSSISQVTGRAKERQKDTDRRNSANISHDTATYQSVQ